MNNRRVIQKVLEERKRMDRRGNKDKRAKLVSVLALLGLVLVPASLVYADCTWTQ